MTLRLVFTNDEIPVRETARPRVAVAAPLRYPMPVRVAFIVAASAALWYGLIASSVAVWQMFG